MSLYVDGVLASSVGFSAVPQSTISRTFLSRLPPRHSFYFGITSAYAFLSTVLQCEISPLNSTDFVLGLDWVSMIREHLLRNGYRLDDSFGPWAFFTQVPPLALYPLPFGPAHGLMYPVSVNSPPGGAVYLPHPGMIGPPPFLGYPPYGEPVYTGSPHETPTLNSEILNVENINPDINPD
ncbi:hypothetical protein B0H16DRAFT_1472953 [Mycena metata]|uniref:Uncharacterized protein n=1 Tax=Mycena metata TaxID=1033252 RepID=A0AAD7HLC7_9AGAR|nr:hypothetical protein B0H16DRAFT_1472953 [Mycena metata]